MGTETSGSDSEMENVNENLLLNNKTCFRRRGVVRSVIM
jgi:hypothetical protein